MLVQVATADLLSVLHIALFSHHYRTIISSLPPLTRVPFIDDSHWEPYGDRDSMSCVWFGALSLATSWRMEE